MNRRSFLQASAGAMLTTLAGATPAWAMISPRTDSRLLARARAALDTHRIARRDRIGIADFGRHSREQRFHLIDLLAGTTTTYLVAHGRGSDPAHSGLVERFSNTPGSNATSRGSYLTAAEYVGAHGRSRRLIGLDPENNNAEDRAIVIHGADYVSPSVVARQGKLGRSQGCLAFTKTDLPVILDRLGPGRLIFADK